MKRIAVVFLGAALAALAGVAPGQQPAPAPPKSTVPAFQIPDIVSDATTGKVRTLATTRTVFLGAKIAPKAGKASLQFSKYLGDVPEPPKSLDRGTKAMRTIRLVYNNDREGCCVSSSTAHGLGIVSAYDSDSPGEIAGSSSEASIEYHKVGGPGDNGLDPVTALEFWRKNGYTLGGTKRVLEAWGEFNPQDAKQVKVCTIVFGGRLVFNVPGEWMNNARDGAVWDKPRGAYNFVGGHDVRIIDYNEKGVRIATWGLVVTVTWAALADRNIFDGAYFEVFSDWLGKDRVTGSGISAKTLADDIAKIKSGETPSWLPDGPPPPPPPPPPGPGGVVTVTVNGETITIDPAAKKVTVPAGWTSNAPGPPAPAQTVEEQLKAKGLTPEQIDLIIRLVAAFLARGPAPSAQGPAPEAWPVASAFAAEGACAGATGAPVEVRRHWFMPINGRLRLRR